MAAMSGLYKVELIDAGPGHATVKTNEGLMKRWNVVRNIAPDLLTLSFDEEYSVGWLATIWCHVHSEFRQAEDGVSHHLTVTDMKTRGLAGFLFRTLGRRFVGHSMVTAYRQYLEGPEPASDGAVAARVAGKG